MIIVIVFAMLAAAALAILGGAQAALVTIIGIGIAAAWFVRRPVYAASATVALQGWSVLTLAEGGLATPAKFAGIVLLFATAGRIVSARRIEPLPRAFAIGLVLLAANMFISEINASFGASFVTLAELFGTLVFFLFVSQIIKQSEDFRTFGIVQAIGLLLMTAYVIAEVGWASMMAGVVRAKGPSGQPNILAEHVARTMPFALALLLDRGNRLPLRALGLAASLGSVYIEFAAASRGGSFGFALGLLLLFALVARSGIGRILSVTVAATVILTIAAVSPKSFEDRVIGTVTAEEDDSRDLTSHRAEQFAMAPSMIAARPFVGHGITGFSTLAGREEHWGAPALHSSVIGMAVAYGIPAATLLTLLMLSGVGVAIRAGLQSETGSVYAYALASGTLAGVVCSLFTPTLLMSYLWFFIACCHVLALRVRMNRRARLAGQMDKPQVFLPSGGRLAAPRQSA